MREGEPKLRRPLQDDLAGQVIAATEPVQMRDEFGDPSNARRGIEIVLVIEGAIEVRAQRFAPSNGVGAMC